MRAMLSFSGQYRLSICRQLSLANSHRIVSSTTTCNERAHINRTFSSNSADASLKAFVTKPYSYAFGRSNRELIYKTLGQLLDERLETDSNRPMIISHYEGIQKTFVQFNEDVNKIAKAMYEDLGLQRGDVVGLWSGNSYNWMAIQYACSRLGIILCTINPYYRAQELDYVLRKAQVKTLFMPGTNSNQELLNKFTNILAETVNLDSKRQNSPNEPLLLKNVVFIDGQANGGELGPAKSDIRVHSLDKLKQNRSSDLNQSLTSLVTSDDPAILMFTSGTTGKPKAACLSQFTVINNGILAMRSIGVVPNEHCVCVPLPFFHSFAFSFGVIASVASPFQLVIPYLKHDAGQLLEAINANKSTHMLATPTLVIDMLSHIKANNIQVPTLQNVTAGGATMPVEIARDLMKTIPSCTQFKIGYGATELGPCATVCKTTDTFEQRTETIGSPLDFVEIRIVDPQTKAIVKLGTAGEIHARGHNRMLGYWRDPEKTAEAVDSAGWYNTGDLGVMDENGFVKIIGRTKELIIVGGENVYPRELEEILHTHPAILDVYVIGVPDKRKGEAICAWIKLKDDKSAVTEEEIRQFCKNNMAYFKVPQYISFVDSFPVTTTGKVQKYIMKEMTCKKLNL